MSKKTEEELVDSIRVQLLREIDKALEEGQAPYALNLIDGLSQVCPKKLKENIK